MYVKILIIKINILYKESDSMNKIKESIHNEFENLKLNKEEYFDNFYRNNYNLVYRICFSILKDEENAKDVTQNIFEKIYKLPNEKLAQNYESTWLYTVSKNEALQYIRKNKFNISLEDEISEIKSSNNEIDKVIEQEQYEKLMKKLNKKEEQIVSLKVLSDFTFKEIGEILSMPTPTVQWYYYKSMKSLKAAIANFGMFLITFVIGLRVKTSVDEKSIIQEDVTENDDLSDEDMEFDASSDSSKSEISSITQSSNTIEDSEISTTTNQIIEIQSYSQSNVHIGVFGVAGIFLIISIIFSIFFIKHQQKTKRNLSK